MKLNFLKNISEHHLILNLMKILLSRAELSHADEETWQSQ